MSLQATSIRIECRHIHHQHVVTSPDVPTLYVASRDEATARRSVQAALDMMERAIGRRAQIQGGLRA